MIDSNDLLTFGLFAAGVLALWFTFKVLKKIVFVVLVFVAVVGIVLGLYLKFLR